MLFPLCTHYVFMICFHMFSYYAFTLVFAMYILKCINISNRAADHIAIFLYSFVQLTPVFWGRSIVVERRDRFLREVLKNCSTWFQVDVSTYVKSLSAMKIGFLHTPYALRKVCDQAQTCGTPTLSMQLESNNTELYTLISMFKRSCLRAFPAFILNLCAIDTPWYPNFKHWWKQPGWKFITTQMYARSTRVKRNLLQAEEAEGVCPAIKSYRDKHKNAKKHHQSCKDVRRHYQSLVRTFAKSLACPKRHPIERLQHRRDWPQQESPYISGKVWPSRHTKLTKDIVLLVCSKVISMIWWVGSYLELPGYQREDSLQTGSCGGEKSNYGPQESSKMWYPHHWAHNGTYQTEGYDGGNDWCQQWPGEHVVICHSCRAQSLIGCMLCK